ncbi:MAG: hypothetical protein WC959_09930 [Kiritimatiellales bacterium]
MSKRVIIGIQIAERAKLAAEVQTVLTEFGCDIRTRLGLHGGEKGSCPADGLILLELVCDKKAGTIKEKLAAIPGVNVQMMVFE